MRRKLIGILVVLLFMLAGISCEAVGESSNYVKGWDLPPSQHKAVMELIQKIYEAGIEGRIIAQYDTQTAGYYDFQKGEVIKFDKPIRTISVAVPDYLSYKIDLQSKLEGLASTQTHNGWRLAKYKVQIDPHGAGGGPGGSFDKVTIYPIEVIKTR